MLRALTCCLALLAPAAASAHSAEVDSTLGFVGSVSGARSTYVGLNLSGAADVVNDRVAVDFGYSLFKDEGSALRHLLMAGAEYLPTDNWNLGLMVIGSPRRRSVYPLELNIPEVRRPGGRGFDEENALVATDWNLGALLMGGYDTFGESSFETAADVTVGVTHYAVSQAGKVQLRDGTIISQDFDDSVEQLRAGLSVTETLWLDTDLNLRGNVYAYSEDPTKVGLIGRAAQPLGVGVPIAPLRFDARLGVNHRFSHHFSAGVGAGLARYVDDQGAQRLLTAKVSLRPVKDLRIFLSATFQRDLVPRLTQLAVRDAVDSAFTNAGVEVRF